MSASVRVSRASRRSFRRRGFEGGSSCGSRRNHAFQGIDRILELRQQALVLAMTVVQNIESTDNNSYGDNCNSTMLRLQLENFLQQLENTGPLSRTINHDFLVLNSFFGQQLKSFSLPSHSKFILWLTLQGDLYFRGGRAASERLSASRIGERVSVLSHVFTYLYVLYTK